MRADGRSSVQQRLDVRLDRQFRGGWQLPGRQVTRAAVDRKEDRRPVAWRAEAVDRSCHGAREYCRCDVDREAMGTAERRADERKHGELADPAQPWVPPL